MAVIELPLAAAKLFILASLTTCPPAQQNPRVDVVYKAIEQPIVTHMTAQQLTADRNNATTLENALGEHAHEAGWMMGGLASNQLGYRVEGSFSASSDPRDGSFCLSLASLTYTVNHESTIYIASDFQKMGCRHSQIMAHERRHVQNFTSAIHRHFPAMRQSLRAYVRKIGSQGPFTAGTFDQHSDKIFKDAHTLVIPIIDKMVHDAAAANARMDNHENYTRESALCPGQFPKFDGTPVNAPAAAQP